MWELFITGQARYLDKIFGQTISQFHVEIDLEDRSSLLDSEWHFSLLHVCPTGIADSLRDCSPRPSRCFNVCYGRHDTSALHDLHDLHSGKKIIRTISDKRATTISDIKRTTASAPQQSPTTKERQHLLLQKHPISDKRATTSAPRRSRCCLRLLQQQQHTSRRRLFER